MTKIFLDTEFNGFGGELISMALVGEDGREFYLPVETKEPINEWVAEHVIPYLNKPPVHFHTFQLLLTEFLAPYKGDFTIVVDWPDDIKYFCQALITSPGYMLPIPAFKIEMRRDLEGVKSALPHNALEDARAIKASYEAVT